MTKDARCSKTRIRWTVSARTIPFEIQPSDESTRRTSVTDETFSRFGIVISSCGTYSFRRHARALQDHARVLDSKLNGNEYARKIVLLKHGTESPVQFGFVRFHLEYVTDAVREQIIAEQIPLGRILINHNVLRHIDLGAILELTAGPELAKQLQMPVGAVTYGRLATIFCNRQPAVDLLEISAPLV